MSIAITSRQATIIQHFKGTQIADKGGAAVFTFPAWECAQLAFAALIGQYGGLSRMTHQGTKVEIFPSNRTTRNESRTS
jgi:hypothetical protein